MAEFVAHDINPAPMRFGTDKVRTTPLHDEHWPFSLIAAEAVQLLAEADREERDGQQAATEAPERLRHELDMLVTVRKADLARNFIEVLKGGTS